MFSVASRNTLQMTSLIHSSVADPGFPRGTSLLFGQMFPESCTIVKEFGSGVRILAPPLDPPMPELKRFFEIIIAGSVNF